jgi:hypothetical protein
MPYAQMMGAKRLLVPLVLVALGASAPAAPALAAGNVASTQAYLSADLALVRAAQANEGASEAALKSLPRSVSSECPNVAVASPQNPDSEALSNELVGAMIVVGTRPNRQAIARFASAVSRLRWSNGRLTNTISSYASQLSALSKMAPPQVCGDVRSWVRSGFQTLPTSSVQFNQAYKAVNVPIGELPEQLLAPYERPGQAGTLRRIQQLETAVADFEARATTIWAEAMNTMVLQP